MKNALQITIPIPCHEDWEKMSVQEKGKLCNSCQKTVFDFTNATNTEIIAAIQNQENVCGRFRIDQLDRNLITKPKKSNYWAIAATAFLGFFSIGNQIAIAQTKQETVQTDKKVDDLINENKKEETISGKIVDENKLALPGASIVKLKSYNGTVSNKDGHFSIAAKKGDTLTISYLGFKNYELVVTSEKNYAITLKEDFSQITSGIVVVGGLHRKRNFLGRTFLKIGNLFRRKENKKH